MEIGRLVGLLDNLRGEIGETLRFPNGPECDFVLEGHRTLVGADDFGSGRLRVERSQRGGIAGEDRGAPLIERGEGLGMGANGKEKDDGEEK